MDKIIACFSEVERLHEEVMQALEENKPQVVADLVYKQCTQLSKVQPSEFMPEHRIMASEVLEKIGLQQTLIHQATEVTNYFLVRLHGASPFEAMG